MLKADESDIIFGEVLKELRKSSGKSQEKLAFDANLERVFISMLERGIRRPTLKTLVALAVGLEMPVNSIVKAFEDKYFERTGYKLHLRKN